MQITMNSDKYFWIVGGGLMQVPLIAEVRKLAKEFPEEYGDLKVIVSDGSSDCACSAIADLFFKIDIFDIQKHVSAAQELVESGHKIVGVLAAGIDAPETMARMARALGLPGVDPEIAHIVNNKHKFREKMREFGFPTPRFEVVQESDLKNLDTILERIGFPLIVKNTDSSGSRGTRIFEKPDPTGIRETLAVAMQVSRSRKALLEEVWVGPEQTVETIFDVNGVFHPCFITDRHFDKSDGYAMETGLRHPSALPSDVQNQMYKLAQDISNAFGIKVGASKFDMMLTKDGPRVIEMTVRLSGGFDCQYLVPAATGKNIMRAAVLTAMGKPFPKAILQDSRHRIGVTGSIWPKPGKITSVNGLADLEKIPGFEQVFFRYKKGDVIQPYTDCTKRVCFLIATGESESRANAALDQMTKTLRIETE